MFEVKISMSKNEANRMRKLQREYMGQLVVRLQRVAAYYKAKAARCHRLIKQLKDENANLRAQLAKKKPQNDRYYPPIVTVDDFCTRVLKYESEPKVTQSNHGE